MRWKRLVMTFGAFALAATPARPSASEDASTRPGHPRPATIEALERAAQGRATWLSVELLGGSDGQVRVGDEIAFQFQSQHDAHLTIVHVDGEGNLSVLGPDSLQAEHAFRFPADDSLGVVLPIGTESVYAFATWDPLTIEQLGLSRAPQGDHATLDPTDGPAFAACLAGHLDRDAARSGKSPAAVLLQYRVRPDGKLLPYTQETVTRYFSTVTRSYKRPTLDLLIHFEMDSDALDDVAKARLDEVGKALKASEIGDFSFALNGHTDDVGEDDYNLDLSRRRAMAARTYLVSQHGVSAERLEPVGHGEKNPKMLSTDPVSRQENRRVEMELLSRGTGLGTRGAVGSGFRCGGGA